MRLERVRSLPISADAAALLALAAWAIVLAVLTWGSWGDLGRDTGYDLLAGARTAGGELPYVDYVYFYGPVAPLLLGGVFSITGAGLGPALAVGFVVVAIILGETYVLGRRLAGPLGGGIAAALAAVAAFGTGNNSFVLPHSSSAPIAIALALAVLIALTSHADSGRRRYLVLAGIAAGLVVLTRPETSVSVGVTLALWSLVRVIVAPNGRGAAVRDAATLLAPAALLPLIGYGVLAAQVGLDNLLFDNLYPRDMLQAAGNTVLRGQAPLTADSFAVLGGRAVLYASGLIAVVAVGAAAARFRPVRIAVAAGFALTALIIVLVAAKKPETLRYYFQFAYGWIPLGAWMTVGALLWDARRRRAAWDQVTVTPILLALMLAVASSTAYGAFYPHPRPDGPQATTYLIPLVALFLVWLHMRALPRFAPGGASVVAAISAGVIALFVLGSAGLIVSDARNETVAVRAAHGHLTAPSIDGGAYAGAVAEVERRTQPGDQILVGPQLTWLYTFTDRTDPLPQLSLLPGSLGTAADEDAAIARMDGVKLAVIDRKPLKQYGHGAFGETFDKRIMAWLQRDFERVATVRGEGPDARAFDIWARSGS